MSPEYLSHIFEPFSRAEDPRISKLQGTGLGMTITENVVRMMNGTIQVEVNWEKAVNLRYQYQWNGADRRNH